MAEQVLHVRRQLSTDSEEFHDEILDPRIQVELEKLNKASEEINKLELELDDARASFRQALSDSTQKLNTLAKKLGACVEKARPYYDARVKAKEAHLETQKAALRYERACSMHEAAKEMVQLAEQGYMRREQESDPAWQEMLNHATMKVNEAEKERNESEHDHERTTINFKDAEERVQQLQKDLKRAITKSKPYFEMKIRFNQIMEDQKLNVSRFEEDVSSAKALYSQALHSLEAISDEIHQQRLERQKNKQLGVRSAGVGAESPSPPPSWDKGPTPIDGSVTPHTSSCYSMPLTTISTGSSDIPIIYASQSNTQFQKEPQTYFHPPSVIHGSPEHARRQSYRKAIETSQNQFVVSPTSDSVCSADYDEDFDVPSLDEEYMTLPNTHSPRGRVDPRNSQHAVDNRPNKDVAWSQDDVFQKQETSVQKVTNTGAESGISQSQPILISEAKSQVDGLAFFPKYIHSNLSTPEGGSPISGSPSTSRKSPKLQGLILRVDPTMDPLQKAYTQQRTVPQRHTPPQQQYYSAQELQSKISGMANTARSSSVESSTLEMQPKTAVPLKERQGSREVTTPTQGQVTLRVPSPSDMSQASVEDSSDTESIASTGPMIDDDQIDFLSLEFSNQTLKEEPVSSFKRQGWNRMSLPPRLSYLEGYLQKRQSISSESPITEQALEGTKLKAPPGT